MATWFKDKPHDHLNLKGYMLEMIKRFPNLFQTFFIQRTIQFPTEKCP